MLSSKTRVYMWKHFLYKNTPLCHVHPSALPPADRLSPQLFAPAGYDARYDSSAGRPVVPVPQRCRASHGEQVLF
jgi:hypothetical protein